MKAYMNNNYKTNFLIFDLDDTLIPSTAIYAQALEAIGLSTFRTQFEEARARAKSKLPQGHTSYHNRLLYFKEMLEAQGRLSPAKALEYFDRYENERDKLINQSWKALKRDKLMRLLADKYTLCILTNEMTRVQLMKLSQMDPHGKYFEHIVTSEEVGFEKPHPRIFDYLYEKLEKAASDQITFVGDSLKNDIEPAIARGWRAIWTQEFLKPEECKVAYPTQAKIISNLEELSKTL